MSSAGFAFGAASRRLLARIVAAFSSRSQKAFDDHTTTHDESRTTPLVSFRHSLPLHLLHRVYKASSSHCPCPPRPSLELPFPATNHCPALLHHRTNRFQCVLLTSPALATSTNAQDAFCAFTFIPPMNSVSLTKSLAVPLALPTTAKTLSRIKTYNSLVSLADDQDRDNVRFMEASSR